MVGNTLHLDLLSRASAGLSQSSAQQSTQLLPKAHLLRAGPGVLGLWRKEMTLPQRGHSRSQNRSCSSAEKPPRPQLVLPFLFLILALKETEATTNLEEYLDWQWSSSLSSSLWHSSQWPKENYKYQGLDFVWNWYIALWGKKSNGRTDRADRQSCPSNSNLTGSKYTHLVADSSQQEMPPISSINLFPWLFVYWQPNSSTHPFPLYPKGSKCKWKTSLKPKRSQHPHYPW